MFSTMVYLDPVQIKLVGPGHKSNYKVIEEKSLAKAVCVVNV